MADIPDHLPNEFPWMSYIDRKNDEEMEEYQRKMTAISEYISGDAVVFYLELQDHWHRNENVEDVVYVPKTYDKGGFLCHPYPSSGDPWFANDLITRLFYFEYEPDDATEIMKKLFSIQSRINEVCEDG